MDKIKVMRKTTESEMTVVLDFSPIKPDYAEKIKTPLSFLNHMIEHIVWRSGVNIALDCKLSHFALTHVICEDLGIALGKAVGEYIKRVDGAYGFGDAIGIIDEAKAECAISFEDRSFCDISYNGLKLTEQVEGMNSEDLATFLQGFAQGAKCTLHIDIQKGENAHHIWEAAFRSVGSALYKVLTVDERRKGMTSGVAGKVQWTVE